VLAGIVSQEAVPPAARVTAAGILLDRGWGKAPQAITGENSEGGINVIIRHNRSQKVAPIFPPTKPRGSHKAHRAIGRTQQASHNR